MTESEIMEKLEEVGAVIRQTHVVYTSGRHGSAYFNKDAIYPHSELTELVTGSMAKCCAPWGVQTVVAPALGGIVLSQWVGHHLSHLLSKPVAAVYAEKEGDGFALRRGYDSYVKGKKVVILEDVVTTGGSLKKVLDCVNSAGGEVVGASVLCNRGNLQAGDLGVPKLASLINLNFDTWEAADCPLCDKGVSVNRKVGKGLEFLKNQGKA